MAHTYHASSQKAETGGWSIPDQPELNGENPSQFFFSLKVGKLKELSK